MIVKMVPLKTGVWEVSQMACIIFLLSVPFSEVGREVEVIVIFAGGGLSDHWNFRFC